MDLSKFKRIQSDEHSTTIAHKDGHMIKVAHKMASPELRDALEKMPMHLAGGGGAHHAETSPEQMRAFGQKPMEPKGTANIGRPDESGDAAAYEKVKQINQQYEDKWQATQKEAKEKPSGQAYGGMIKQHYADGGDVQPDSQDANKQPVTIHIYNGPQPNQPVSAPPSPQEGPPSSNPSAGGQAEAPAVAQQSSPMPPQQGLAPSGPPVQNPNDPFGYQASLGAQMHGLQEQKQGEMQQAQAQGEMGKANIAHEQQAVDQEQQALYSYNQNLNRVHDERASLQNDIANQHIDPRRYLDNMSTGKHIMTGIGLVLGGMGAGLTHGPNLAYDFLNKQISNDIDSQKEDLGKKQNLLSHNFQEEGDLNTAMGITRIQTNDLLAAHLRQEADKSQDPMTKGRLLGIAGKFDMESGKLQQQMALTKTMMGSGSNQDNEEAGFQKKMQFLRMNGQEALAKDMEMKHVPGVGQSSREVPPEALKEMTSRNDLQKKLEDLQQFSAKHSGSLSPSTIKEGKAKAALLQDAYRRANAQGVFKESEKNFVEGIIGSDPTQFFNKYRAGKAYKELSRDNKGSLDSLKNSYGLPTSEGQKSQQSDNPMEGQTATGPGGKRIKMVNGKWEPLGSK